MARDKTFTAYLKTQHPAIWTTLRSAAADGLVVIDEEIDAVTATHRLLLTYPDLHEVLMVLMNDWAERREDFSDAFASLLHGSEEDGVHR